MHFWIEFSDHPHLVCFASCHRTVLVCTTWIPCRGKEIRRRAPGGHQRLLISILFMRLDKSYCKIILPPPPTSENVCCSEVALPTICLSELASVMLLYFVIQVILYSPHSAHRHIWGVSLRRTVECPEDINLPSPCNDARGYYNNV